MSDDLFHGLKRCIGEALQAANEGKLTHEHLSEVHQRIDALEHRLKSIEIDSSGAPNTRKTPFNQRPLCFKKDDNHDRVGVYVYGRRIGNARDQGSLLLFESGGKSQSFTTKRKLYDWVWREFVAPRQQVNGVSHG